MDLSKLSNEELDALYNTAIQTSNASVDTVPTFEQMDPLSGLSDAELNALYQQEAAKRGDGTVVNAESRDAATDAQTKYFADEMKAGRLNADSPWGSVDRPLLGVPGRTGEPGQYFVDLDGKLRQVPGQYDEGLGFAQGVLKPWNNAAGLAEDGLRTVGVPVDAINQFSHDYLGMANGVDDARMNQQRWFDQAAQEGRIPGGVGRFAGEVVGTAPLALLAPEGLAGSIVTGGLSGAALTDKRDAAGIAGDIALGSVLGGGLHGAGSLLARPPIGGSAKVLADSGVPLTTGQILGFPEGFIGDAVPFAGAARRASADGYATGAANQVLAPLGQSVPKGYAGQNAVEFVQAQIGNAAEAAAAKGDRAGLEAAQEAARRLQPFRQAATVADNFAPNDLLDAVRQTHLEDFGRGTAPLQDYAQAGLDVMGTPPPAEPRGLLGMAADQLGLGRYINPQVAAMLGAHATGLGAPASAASAAYSPWGQGAIRGVLLGDRPAALRGIGSVLDGRTGGLLGGSFGSSVTGASGLPTYDWQYPNDPYAGQY